MQNILNELTNLNEQELITLNQHLRARLKRLRAAKSKAMKMSLNKGDTVKWVGRNGPASGTVTEIKRKFAHVDVGAQGTLRVPMNMLVKV